MKKYVVIGAGILGASAAYYLAKAGADVTVIDRKDPGQATGAAAGIICPWLTQRRNKAWYALAKGGAAYYSELISKLEEDGETETGYAKVGALSLHTDPEKLTKMEERALARREDAPEIGSIQKLGPEESSALFPPLDAAYFSVHVGGAARVDGRALRDALISAGKKHGAIFAKGSAVLELSGGEVVGVKTGDSVYPADTVILTAGAWANEVFAPLGLTMKLTAQKGQIIHLRLDGTETGGWPVVMPPNDQYMLAFEQGKVVIGTTHEEGVAFDMRITAGGVNEILGKGLAVAPGLEDAEFSEARVGYRPYTPGFLPVIGSVPGFDNVLLANGLGASGLTVGPYLGAQLGKLALGEELDIDLSLYDASSAFE